ncbi:virulence factor family protein [Pseudomonas sp. NPDC090203]|uniref:virulence factor family protein n=1 Tax=Pseudomonas sp. NPDC090203 TaxID=3364477 RepID=UPI003801CF2C
MSRKKYLAAFAFVLIAATSAAYSLHQRPVYKERLHLCLPPTPAMSNIQRQEPTSSIMVSDRVLLLAHSSSEMQVTEIAPTPASDTLTVFYSGDGGWRDLDKEISEIMGGAGYPVIGVDTLRYYWKYRSPEESAADLTALMDNYRQRWGIKHFVLAGYSFGADVLPAIYNRLQEKDKNAVSSILLLAFARKGSFEIHLDGWIKDNNNGIETGSEMAKLPASKVLCVYGVKEKKKSGCTDTTIVGEVMQLPGKHHFDRDYNSLTLKLLEAIKHRNTTAVL